MEPITASLLVFVLGKLATEIIGGACKDFLKDKLNLLFAQAEKLGSKSDLELAYASAMQQAFETCCEILLRNIETFGVQRLGLLKYRQSLELFIADPEVAAELYRSVENPNDETAPSPHVLLTRWQEVGGRDLPSNQLWAITALAYRNQSLQQTFLSDPLRELLTAKNTDQLLKEVLRQGGVRTQIRKDKYSQRMRTKFSPVDLANLMPAYADDPGRIVIRDVFVAQYVREDPPPIEIPKDLANHLSQKVTEDPRVGSRSAFDEQQLQKLRSAYVAQPPRPVLDTIAEVGNRLLVLTGEPGSGKTTLMRYLLTGLIEPPVDRDSGQALPWTAALEDAFPLLIELRDFHALRRSDECNSFLDYVAYMGVTDQWFLDDHAVHRYLEDGPALVMFDGLDEIFDLADRERVMHEIAGFAQRYPLARIIVTSRPVGYKEQTLREAGFSHFGIQDLTDEQIRSFVVGWFSLTFPGQPQQAKQRVERVLESVRNSQPIRLLAGNPMLLTIMALLAREEELPRERAKFYEKAVEVLCHHWDANRNLDLPEDHYLNADDKKALLRRVSIRMQTGASGLKGNIIHEHDLEGEIQSYLTDEQWQPNAAEARKAARRMIRQLRERNYILCLRGPHMYGFVHRTILEYLTAAEYVRLFDKQPQQMTIEELIDLFDRHCRDDDWREVLRLICGQIDEQFVGRIVEHLATRPEIEEWDGESSLPEMMLAISCLGEVRNLGRMEAARSCLITELIRVLPRVENWDFIDQQLVQALKDVVVPWVTDAVKSQLLDAGNMEDAVGIGGWAYLMAYATRNGELIREFGEEHPDFMARWSLYRAIADIDHSEKSRMWLGQRAMHDEEDGSRDAALEALAEEWPDESTRELLVRHVDQASMERPPSRLISALARNWRDEKARKLLIGWATQEEAPGSHHSALEALAENWPDESTRELLVTRVAQENEEAFHRCRVIGYLARNWPDDRTRQLIAKRATQDASEDVRFTALRELARNWPDEISRELLQERAAIDGAAASVLGGQLNSFGGLIYSENLDGRAPFLDPSSPLSFDRIAEASANVEAPADETDRLVLALSAHLGWDITKGSAGMAEGAD